MEAKVTGHLFSPPISSPSLPAPHSSPTLSPSDFGHQTFPLTPAEPQLLQHYWKRHSIRCWSQWGLWAQAKEMGEPGELCLPAPGWLLTSTSHQGTLPGRPHHSKSCTPCFSCPIALLWQPAGEHRSPAWCLWTRPAPSPTAAMDNGPRQTAFPPGKSSAGERDIKDVFQSAAWHVVGGSVCLSADVLGQPLALDQTAWGGYFNPGFKTSEHPPAPSSRLAPVLLNSHVICCLWPGALFFPLRRDRRVSLPLLLVLATLFYLKIVKFVDGEETPWRGGWGAELPFCQEKPSLPEA